MNADELFVHVGDRTDFSPFQSAAALKRFARYANLGLSEIHSQAPYLFTENERRFTVPVAIKPVAGERLDVVDPWLLKLDSTATLPVANWRTDGTMCTQAIVLNVDGNEYRRVIQGVALISGEIFVTLTQPYPNSTDTSINFQVITVDFYLPKDLLTIETLRLADQWNTGSRGVSLIGRRDGRALTRTDSVGHPWRAHDGGDVQIPLFGAITAAQASAGGAWSVDSPGDFEYCYTVSWGKRPEQMGRPTTAASTTTRLRPLVQSAASPIISETATSGNSITITFPDVAAQLSQNSGTKANADLLGHHLNLYRARGGAQFHLLASIPVTTLTYVDTGTQYVDLFQKLPATPGVRSLTFDSTPNSDIIVDGQWTPVKIRGGDDPIPLTPQGVKALIAYVSSAVFRKNGEREASKDEMNVFELIIRDLAQSEGTAKQGLVRMGKARVGGGIRYNGYTIIPDYDEDFEYV